MQPQGIFALPWRAASIPGSEFQFLIIGIGTHNSFSSMVFWDSLIVVYGPPENSSNNSRGLGFSV